MARPVSGKVRLHDFWLCGLDTCTSTQGALYRAVAWKVPEAGLSPTDRCRHHGIAL